MNVRMIVQGVVATSMLLALASVSAVTAEPRGPSKAAYMRYCSACHGENGKGEGVVSQYLRPKPSDLTQIAKANHGDFPFNRMIRIIDGRETVRAHGDADMPVWGDIFRAEDGMSLNAETRARGKALQITEYVSSLQEK